MGPAFLCWPGLAQRCHGDDDHQPTWTSGIVLLLLLSILYFKSWSFDLQQDNSCLKRLTHHLSVQSISPHIQQGILPQ